MKCDSHTISGLMMNIYLLLHIGLAAARTIPTQVCDFFYSPPVYTEIFKYYTMNLAISLGHWRESGLNPIARCLNNMNYRTIQFSTTNFAPVILYTYCT